MKITRLMSIFTSKKVWKFLIKIQLTSSGQLGLSNEIIHDCSEIGPIVQMKVAVSRVTQGVRKIVRMLSGYSISE